MQETKVALIGMGTVGTGVAQILLNHADRIARHAGRRLQLAAVVVKDPSKARRVDIPSAMISDDLRLVTENPEIRVVAHLMGGIEPARTVMLKLLESGKDVVTANKALLAEHGAELFDRARSLGRSIAFEASVAGGVPIITNISQCLSANQILQLSGILNGTSNFIVSQMEEHGRDYHAALAEAQARGFAEADPTMDVDGSDAAQKLAILAHLAFGARGPWQAIPRQGIDALDPLDLKFAKDLGYRIKVLATAKLHGVTAKLPAAPAEGALELHVAPTLVKIGTPMAEVRNAYNAISVEGDYVGRVFYHGLGAGAEPTASAVMADMIDTAVGRTAITFRTLELWSEKHPQIALVDHALVEGRYYLRLLVDDHPGVLAEIASILGRHRISIASLIQREWEPAHPTAQASLVIMTHRASEGAAARAVAELNRLSCVKQPCVRMRVAE
ncbi:MAG: homoserine dehydrogenase [Pirellulales bacterium]